MFNQREKDLQKEALKIVFGLEDTEQNDFLDTLAEQILGNNKKLNVPKGATRYSFLQNNDEKTEDQGPQQH